jgi:hypothetical protein
MIMSTLLVALGLSIAAVFGVGFAAGYFVRAMVARQAREMRSSDGVSPESARPPQTNRLGRWLAALTTGV